MTSLSSTASAAPRHRSHSHARGLDTQTALNKRMFWALLGLVALVPLPLGSARPFFWAMAGACVGLASLLYALSLIRLGEDFRLIPAFGKLLGSLFALFCLAFVAQLLPIGGLFGGFAVASGAGLELTSNQISIAPGMTLFMLIRQLSYALFLFLAMQVMANESRRLRMLDGLLIVILAYGAYGMISLQSGDTILGMPKWAYLGNATGTFVNRNSFATFLAMGAAIAAVRIAGLLVERSHQHPDDGRIKGIASALVLNAMALAFLFLVIIATQSRMGLFAGIVGSLAGFCLLLGKAQGRIRLAGPLIAIPLVGAIAFGVLGNEVFDRFVQIEGDSTIRTNLYAQILELIGQRPFIGWGGGSFEHAFQLVHRPPVNVDYTWQLGHNTYLSLWAELGVFAGSIPIVIIAALAALILKRFFTRSTDSRSIVPQAAAIAVIVVVGVHALADFSLEIPANAFMLMAVLATALGTLPRPGRGN